MPHFNYTGTDHKTSAEYQGTIEAASERDAADKLREQGIIPATINGDASVAQAAAKYPPFSGAPFPPGFGTSNARPSRANILHS